MTENLSRVCCICSDATKDDDCLTIYCAHQITPVFHSTCFSQLLKKASSPECSVCHSHCDICFLKKRDFTTVQNLLNANSTGKLFEFLQKRRSKRIKLGNLTLFWFILSTCILLYFCMKGVFFTVT